MYSERTTERTLPPPAQRRVFELLDGDIYDATLEEIYPVESQWSTNRWACRFVVDREDGDPASVTHFVNGNAFGDARSYLTQMARALCGDAVDGWSECDPAALLDKRCRLVVELETRQDGSQRNKVTKVMAPAKAPPRVRSYEETMGDDDGEMAS